MNKLIKQSILGIGITVNPKAEILNYINEFIVHSSWFTVIFTPNPEQVVYAHSHPEFAKLLNSAEIAIPDGVGLQLANWLVPHFVPITIGATRGRRSQFTASPDRSIGVHSKRKKLKEPSTIYHIPYTNHISSRVPGVELMEDLVQMATEQGFSIGLIGGRGDLAFDTYDRLAIKYKGLPGFALSSFNVSQDGTEDSSQKILRYFDEKSKEQRLSGTQTSQLINEYLQLFPQPLFIFVGLGAPKQEFYISHLSDLSYLGDLGEKTKGVKSPTGQSIVYMSVGGAFEMLSGRVKRAPTLVRSLGFEWLWRLLLESWRWRRQLTLLKFIWLVVKNRGNKGN